MPQHVPRPVLAPGHCIANLSTEDPRGFIDFEVDPAVVDPHIYLSAQAVIDAGRLLGLPSPDQYAAVLAELEDARIAIELLRVEVAEKAAALGAVHTLRQAGYQAAKKPGRPRKVEA